MALILSQVQGGYFSRVIVVTLLGVFGAMSLLASYVIWYGFPLDYILGETITEVVGCFLAGLALAAIVKPAAPEMQCPSRPPAVRCRRPRNRAASTAEQATANQATSQSTAPTTERAIDGNPTDGPAEGVAQRSSGFPA